MPSADARTSDRTLWWLAAAPAVWLLHFFVSYTTAAIFCAKASGESLGPVRVAIAIYTAVGLVALAGIARRGLRRHPVEDAIDHEQFDDPSERSAFLGLAYLLLSGLGAVGVVYVALPALFVETCR